MIIRLDSYTGRPGHYQVVRLPAPVLTMPGRPIGSLRQAGEAWVATPHGLLEVICKDQAEAIHAIVKHAQKARLGLTGDPADERHGQIRPDGKRRTRPHGGVSN